MAGRQRTLGRSGEGRDEGEEGKRRISEPKLNGGSQHRGHTWLRGRIAAIRGVTQVPLAVVDY